MLFNSLKFAVFFPIVFALHFLVPPRWRWLLLLVASYLFYMAWEPAYAILILTSTVIDYVVSNRLGQVDDPRQRKALLGVSLALNLGLLFSFKYYNLVNSTFSDLAARLGVDWPLPESNLLLPVGISFYTFQTIGYTVDVYRRRIEPERHFGTFALYVSYFPQLVAGPIERAGRLLPQLRVPHGWDWERVVTGFRQAAWGMFKKVVIADRLAEVVGVIYDQPHDFGGFAYIVGTVFFASQVYCDFSGYADIAIGIARMMGVDLMKNFDRPHWSRSVAELWTRWHISLTSWFRDYVYIPLGGNRVPPWRWAANVLAVFLLSGIWHGATWGFAVWGAANGLLIVIERWTAPAREAVVRAIGLDRLPRLHAFVQWAITFCCWLLTLVFFRADNLTEGVYMLTHLGAGWEHFGHPAALLLFLKKVNLDVGLFVYCIALMPLAEVVDWYREDERARRWWRELPAAARWAADYAVIFGTLAFGNFADLPFVYFQF